MHEVLVNRLGGLSLPRKSVVRLTDRPDMTLDVYRGRKTTIQQQPNMILLTYTCKKVQQHFCTYHVLIKNSYVISNADNLSTCTCGIPYKSLPV